MGIGTRASEQDIQMIQDILLICIIWQHLLSKTTISQSSQLSIGEVRWGLAIASAEAVAADVKPFHHFLIALGARESVPRHPMGLLDDFPVSHLSGKIGESKASKAKAEGKNHDSSA